MFTNPITFKLVISFFVYLNANTENTYKFISKENRSNKLITTNVRVLLISPKTLGKFTHCD